MIESHKGVLLISQFLLISSIINLNINKKRKTYGKDIYNNLDKLQKPISRIKQFIDFEEEKCKYFITKKIEDNFKLYFTLNEAIVNK